MGIDARYNSESWGGSDVKHKGICPTGWHLPSNAEWKTLIDFVDSAYTDAGTKLKATSGWISYSGVPSGLNTWDFAALPGGFGGYSDGYFNFSHIGYTGFWWSATDYKPNYAHELTMRYDVEYVNSFGTNKGALISVRCLQN